MTVPGNCTGSYGVSCAGGSIGQQNCQAAKVVIRQAFAELEASCIEERAHYAKIRSSPSVPKSNRWAAYTDKEKLRSFMAESMEFIRNHPECRHRLLSSNHLRFLVLLQHNVSQDVSDVYKPAEQRKHGDTFEGILTDAVNSQLVKDAHRSEWSIEGCSYTLIQQLKDGNASHEDQRQRISDFQAELVKALEEYLLAFATRRGLSDEGARRFVASVTTQMSQSGLANLDCGSQASRYFVSGQGLDQRTAFNLSSMDAGVHGESLKLSLMCMKTGFQQYHTEETLGAQSMLPSAPPNHAAPKQCGPGSYLYQYATLRFTPVISTAAYGGPTPASSPPPPVLWERCNCVVLDALDEAHFLPA